MENEAVSYKPGAWYYRKAIRESSQLDQAKAAGLVVVLELEYLKSWIREQGLIPPKRFVSPAEASAKGWSGDELPQSDFVSR